MASSEGNDAGGCDYWRLPALTAEISPSASDDDDAEVEKTAATSGAQQQEEQQADSGRAAVPSTSSTSPAISRHALQELFELNADAAKKGSYPVPLSSLDVVGGSEALSQFLKGQLLAADEGPAFLGGWRALALGELRQPAEEICGALRPVPPLPNPLTLLADVPALVAEMLQDIPQEERDQTRFLPAKPVPELGQLLFRGPGTLLPTKTPRLLAQNALAAAILNRLCANFLIGASARAKGSGNEHPTREELAIKEASKIVEGVKRSVQDAVVEEGEALAALEAFRKRGELDAEEQRKLEGVVDWKKAVVVQEQAELKEAERKLAAAEAAWSEACRSGQEPLRWERRWAGIVPAEAADCEPFGVRLIPKGPIQYSLRDFLQAMQHGAHDRMGGGFVQKHALEAAFVRHAIDPLLLCSRSSDLPEASQVYTHFPTCEAVACGLANDSTGADLLTARPHHTLLISLEGATFPFAVAFGAASGSQDAGALGFTGIGTTPSTFTPPWNPVEYGQVMWAQEAQESLDYIPVIAALASLVHDPDRKLGPFPPLSKETWMSSKARLGSGGLALLQAVVFNDVKMWPVAMPDAARLRWELLLRAFQAACGKRGATVSTNVQVDLDVAGDEVLPQCLKALPKVPHDPKYGAACDGSQLVDMLKRVEHSALTGVPFQCAAKLRKLVEEVSEMWPRFVEDTGI